MLCHLLLLYSFIYLVFFSGGGVLATAKYKYRTCVAFHNLVQSSSKAEVRMGCVMLHAVRNMKQSYRGLRPPV